MKNYEHHHTSLPNEDLVRIAYFELRETKKAARQSAKNILAQRKLSKTEITELKIDIRKAKQEERYTKYVNKNNKYGLFSFLIDLILYG